MFSIYSSNNVFLVTHLLHDLILLDQQLTSNLENILDFEFLVTARTNHRCCDLHLGLKFYHSNSVYFQPARVSARTNHHCCELYLGVKFYYRNSADFQQ